MRTWLCLPLLATLATAQGLSLEKLAVLARERAAQQRPAQVQALKPHLAMLGTSYLGDNKTELEQTFQQITKLDGIVPLLLEDLTPADSTTESLNLSDNCARVLSRLSPSDYYDTLMDLARGTSRTAKRNALWLLGFTGNRGAEPVLIAALDETSDTDRLKAVESLHRLQSIAGLQPAARLLANENRLLRQRVLAYLTETDTSGKSLTTVLAAFQKEEADTLLGYYVDYLRAHVDQDATIAESLLPLVGGSRLRYDDRRQLVRAFGSIAPPGHRPTIEALETVVSEGSIGEIEIAAALALHELGEKGGAKQIENRLDQAVRKRRSTADPYADRGDWFRELAKWREAIRDYESAIKYSRSGSRRATLYLLVARCEAHRGKPLKVRNALKNSNVSLRTIEREAQKDEVFAAVLKKDPVKRFLDSL